LHNDATVFPERKLTQADRSALNRRNAEVSWFPMVCESPHSNPVAQLMLAHKVVKGGKDVSLLEISLLGDSKAEYCQDKTEPFTVSLR